MMSEIETIVRLYVSNSSFITYAWLVVELWLGNFVSQPKIMIVDYMSDYNTNVLKGSYEENFNFSTFKRKLKFHIFSWLKFCFKILKI